MLEQKTNLPLKAGLLTVALSYFLFNIHSVFTLQWIGEWERPGGSINYVQLIEDIPATIGLIFRLLASIIALTAVIYYIFNKGFSRPKLFTALKLIFIFEGIYWLGLIATGAFSVYFFVTMILNNRPLFSVLNSLALSVIPTLIESVILPVCLFILAFKLSPNKPLKAAIKWGFITGIIYIVVFWLIYSSIWILILEDPLLGSGYLISYPQNLVSFIVTIFGLPSLIIYTAYFGRKSSGIETFLELKMQTAGAIILAAGMYFLWNYVSWVIFGEGIWSYWYAWFLGHNMDLWMLSLPLVGLPLLFKRTAS